MKMKIAAIILGIAFATSSHAASIISNGSFEFANAAQAAGTETPATGGFHGWTTSGVLSAQDSGNFWVLAPTDGTYLGLWAAGGYVEQTVSTVIGTTYDVSYDWAFAINGNQALRTASTSVNVNSLLTYSSPTYSQINGVGDADTVWYNNAFTFTATDTSTTLRFISILSSGSQADTLMDNIVVTAAVPEPGLTTFLGLGGFALVMRRRRSNRANTARIG